MTRSNPLEALTGLLKQTANRKGLHRLINLFTQDILLSYRQSELMNWENICAVSGEVR